MLTRKTKKVLAIVLTGAVALPGMASGTLVSAKAKCTTKKMTLQAGEKKTIKIKGKVKKAKYMFKSSKPSIAKVNKKGTVTAKKAGKALITITEKKKEKKKNNWKSKCNCKKQKRSKENSRTIYTAINGSESNCFTDTGSKYFAKSGVSCTKCTGSNCNTVVNSDSITNCYTDSITKDDTVQWTGCVFKTKIIY